VAHHAAYVDPSPDNMEDVNPDQYLNLNHTYDDAQPDDDFELNLEDMDHEMPDQTQTEHASLQCKKSLFGKCSLEDTPPDAYTQDKAAQQPPNILSPNTMLTGICAGFAETQPGPGTKKKQKHRKRGKKGANAASMSQPPPVIRVHDSVPVRDAPVLHISGRPMLPANELKGLTQELRRLHDHVLSTEHSLL